MYNYILARQPPDEDAERWGGVRRGQPRPQHEAGGQVGGGDGGRGGGGGGALGQQREHGHGAATMVLVLCMVTGTGYWLWRGEAGGCTGGHDS